MPRALRRIQLTVSARAARSDLNAELYWQTANMADFSGEARAAFPIRVDALPHTYNVRLPVRGDSPILRLRLDPDDAPAELQIQEMVVDCR